MKKVLALLVCLCVMITASACGEIAQKGNKKADVKPKAKQELVINQTHSVDEFAEFSIFKIHTTSKITPTMGGFFCFNNDNEGETYIDVIFEWKNISKRGVDSSELITFTANGEKEYTQVFYTIETDNGTDLSQHVDIEPDSTVRLHCALSVPQTETDLILNFKSKDQEFFFDYALGTTISVAQPLVTDLPVEAPDHASFTLTEVMYTDDVLPSNTEGQYYHYTIKDPANTYLVIKFDLTNYQSTAVSCDEFVNINVVYQNKYSYSGSVYVEDEDGAGFNPYEEIIPLSTRHFYYLVEVPKTVIEHEANITVAFARQEYTYTFQNQL